MFETLGLTIAEFQGWLLVFIRIVTLLAVLPFFSNESLDPRLRMFLGFFLSLICFKIVPYPSSFPVSFFPLMFLAIKEVFVGLAIGVFSSFIFESFRFAGTMISQLMGLNISSMLDPMFEEESEVLPELINILGTLLIIAINGHHFFIKVIMDSFFTIPLTEINLPPAMIPRFIYILQIIFILGIKFAAPIIIILYLSRVIVGLLNRMVQEADVFSIIIILNILLGFYILMFYWPYFATMVNQSFELFKREFYILIKMMQPAKA